LNWLLERVYTEFSIARLADREIIIVFGRVLRHEWMDDRI
jgi:hypothetical protein